MKKFLVISIGVALLFASYLTTYWFECEIESVARQVFITVIGVASFLSGVIIILYSILNDSDL